MAGDSAACHFKAHQFACRALCLDFFKRCAADKIAFFEFDHPAQARLDGIGRFIDIISIQGKPRLEAKRVACGQSRWNKAERRAVLEDPEFMERLHLLAWVHWPAYLPGILDALREGVEPGSPEPSAPEHRPGGPVPAVA